MQSVWNDTQPIYQQIRDRIAEMILDGILKADETIPSVRQTAADCQVNPLTVMKAYQQLADEGLLEKRRGLGFFVTPDARKQLSAREREFFLQERWPETLRTIRRLELSLSELLKEGDIQ